MQTTDAFFVTRAKDTMRYDVVELSYNIDETCGLRSEKTVLLTQKTVSRKIAVSCLHTTLGSNNCVFACCIPQARY